MGDEEPKTKPRLEGCSSPWIRTLRKRGEKLLHSKYLVSLVIILTIIDCSLVIAELILDLYSVKKTLLLTEGQTFKFIRSIRKKYPDQVRPNDTVSSIYDRMSHSIIIWNNTREYDFDIDSLNFDTPSTLNLGMPYSSVPTVAPETSNRQPSWDSFSKTVIVQNGDVNSFSSSRSRRSYKSNTNFPYKDNYRHNEQGDRSYMGLVFSKYFHRVKRFLSKSITTYSKRIFLDSNSNSNFIDDDDDDDYNSAIGNDSNQSNDTQGKIDTINSSIHQQISETSTMQPKVLKTHSAVDVADGDVGVNFKSVVYSLESLQDAAAKKDDDVFQGYPSNSGESYMADVGSSRKGETEGERSRRKRYSDDEDEGNNYEKNLRKELHHSAEMEIAHKLHYASVVVSSVLVVDVALKVICAGTHFFKRKIQVFDAIVIVTSVIVDLIFMKGLPEFAVDDSIFVLALLLPWRVIRVVNSLVMAVIDHEQVKLRLLYSRKKKLDKTVESLRNEMDEIKGTLQDIRSFCIKEGVEATKIDGMLGKFAPRRRKDSKFYTLVKLVMSTASINNNDNDSVSSSSIENDLRHYSNKDSVLNLAASSRGTMASLKQYLSVPFSNDDSHSISDVDSLAGDQPGLSPSIFITSPVSDDGRGVMTFCDVDMEDRDVKMTSAKSIAYHEEGNTVATIPVTSNTTSFNSMNGVSFFVGSQTSLDIGDSQEDLSTLQNEMSRGDTAPRPNFLSIPVEAPSNALTDTNKNFSSHHFRQYLTVPYCEDGVIMGSNLTNVSCSSNNNVNNADDTPSSTTCNNVLLLPHVSTDVDIERSSSDNMNVSIGFSPYEGIFSHGQVGSPAPMRRLPEVRTKRKIYSRSQSESEDNEFLAQIKQDRAGRVRRNSGDPQAIILGRMQEPHRARSHSPSPMTFLSVPGSNKNRTDISCATSRSMNDVSSAGIPYSNNSGDGTALRRSCLSLNTDGQKRKDKSPHRVSFKVS